MVFRVPRVWHFFNRISGVLMSIGISGVLGGISGVLVVWWANEIALHFTSKFFDFFCHGVDDDETARQPRRYIEPSTPNVHWRSVRVGSIESRTFVLYLVSLSTYYEVPMQRQWLKKNVTRDNLLVYTIQFLTIVCSGLFRPLLQSVSILCYYLVDTLPFI